MVTDALPHQWWPVQEAPAFLGDAPGAELLTWLRETVAQPHRSLGRAGPLCPFVPAAMTRRSLLCTVVDDAAADPVERILAAAEEFLSVPPVPPDPAAVTKSLLVIFPNLAEPMELPIAVESVKETLIREGLTCGDFYPNSDDRSARSAELRVARSPLPLVALRYLSGHDELFLAEHPRYGHLFEEWRNQDD